MAFKLDVVQKTQVIQLEDVSNYFFGLPKSVFPFQRSSAGSTGVTFLPLDWDFKWVVKWQNPSLTEVECLCTEFYRRAFVHLSIPQAICVLPDELKKKMREVFKAQNISDAYIPMLLEYKNGSTLNKLFEFAHILKLSPEERTKLFIHIGEIAGYDFLIANFDRLAPAGFKGTIDKRHSVNGGNLMVEFVIPSNSATWEGNGSVSTVHVIDNAPQPILFFAPEERRIEDLSDNLDMRGFALFEEDDYEEHSMEVESQGVVDSDQGILLREQRFQDFQNFMQSDPQGISLLASQIYIGIKNEWIRISRDKTLDLPNFIEDPTEKEVMERSLEEGLWKARNNLKELPLQQVLEELEAENNATTKAAEIVFDFIKKNLAFTQN